MEENNVMAETMAETAESMGAPAWVGKAIVIATPVVTFFAGMGTQYLLSKWNEKRNSKAAKVKEAAEETVEEVVEEAVEKTAKAAKNKKAKTEKTEDSESEGSAE